jgi:uncharacterized membrane protein YhhN
MINALAKKAQYIFIIAAFFNLLAQVHILNLEFLNIITKPMLMPALALFFYFSTFQTNHTQLRNWVLFALLFAWLGDVFLMFVPINPVFFIIGLGAFLIMQIGYIIVFKPISNINLQKNLHFVLPILLFSATVLFCLLPNLGGFKIPVICYFFAILCMVFASLNFVNSKINIIFIGAVFFMISDSLIAVNKFLFALPLAGLWIMATYILAQWLIINGLTQHIVVAKKE